MSAKKAFEGGIKKGEVRNPTGRPKGTGGPRSKLRNILSKFEEMCKVNAPQIIQQSLEGENVDKEKLATAKWVVTTYKTLHQACIQEEQMKRDGSTPVEVEDDDREKDKAVVFQLHMTDSSGTKEVVI